MGESTTGALFAAMRERGVCMRRAPRPFFFEREPDLSEEERLIAFGARGELPAERVPLLTVARLDAPDPLPFLPLGTTSLPSLDVVRERGFGFASAGYAGDALRDATAAGAAAESSPQPMSSSPSTTAAMPLSEGAETERKTGVGEPPPPNSASIESRPAAPPMGAAGAAARGSGLPASAALDSGVSLAAHARATSAASFLL
jgi:hypothetical protein